MELEERSLYFPVKFVERVNNLHAPLFSLITNLQLHFFFGKSDNCNGVILPLANQEPQTGLLQPILPSIAVEEESRTPYGPVDYHLSPSFKQRISIPSLFSILFLTQTHLWTPKLEPA
jgi:hypothetical protein